MSIVRLTQDDMDFLSSNEEYLEFLSGAEVGDWVFDDGTEVLVSSDVIDHWLCGCEGAEREKYESIRDELNRRNNKSLY